MFCDRCGNKFEDGDKFCAVCGNPRPAEGINEPEYETESKEAADYYNFQDNDIPQQDETIPMQQGTAGYEAPPTDIFDDRTMPIGTYQERANYNGPTPAPRKPANKTSKLPIVILIIVLVLLVGGGSVAALDWFGIIGDESSIDIIDVITNKDKDSGEDKDDDKSKSEDKDDDKSKSKNKDDDDKSKSKDKDDDDKSKSKDKDDDDKSKSKDKDDDDDKSKSKDKNKSKDDDDDKGSGKSGKATPAPTPAPTPVPAPKFTSVAVSSTRGMDHDSRNGNKEVYYYADYMFDGDPKTAWSPDRTIDSQPSFTLSAPTKQHVSGIRFANGYFKSNETYTKNRRITKARIEYEGGSVEVTCGVDQFGVLQNVSFGKPVDTTYIKLTVLESVDGGWHDIAISTVEVY